MINRLSNRFTSLSIALFAIVWSSAAWSQAVASSQNDVGRLIADLEDARESTRLAALDRIIVIGPKARRAVHVVGKCLGDACPQVREKAIQAMVEIGPAALPELLKILSSGDGRMANAAADVLVELGPTGNEAIPFLEKLLLSKDKRAVAVAVRAYASILGTRSTRQLIRMLHDDLDESVDNAILDSLRELGCSSAAGARAVGRCMQIACEQNNHALASQAAETLASMGESAVNVFKQLLEDKQQTPRCQRYALGGLRDLASRHVRSPMRSPKDLVHAVKKIVDTGLPELRVPAIKALGAMGASAQDALPSIERALVSMQGIDRLTTAESMLLIEPNNGAAIAVLVKGLGNASSDTRRAAAQLVGDLRLRSRPVINGLRAALDDPVADVRLCAAYALCRMGAEAIDCVPALTKLLDDDLIQMRRAARSAIKAIRQDAQSSDES